MYSFEATYDASRGKIVIASNTYWSCTTEGNFMLSNYSGIGNGELTLDIPQDVSIAEGKITFCYGDDRCVYPTIDIYEGNTCYLMTVPSFMTKKGKRELYFHFDYEGEIFSIEIITSTYSTDSWAVKATSNAYAIATDDLLTVISKDKSGYVIIGPKNCDSDEFDVKIYICGEAQSIEEPEEPIEPDEPIEPEEPTTYDIIVNGELTCSGGTILFEAVEI